MPRIHVCSLARIGEVAGSCGARSMITLMKDDYRVDRPACIAQDRHLHLSVSDIVEAADGYALAQADHVGDLIGFVRAWDRSDPLLIHCFAGVSRSTAAAFIAACALRPEWPESDIAEMIRERSPTATPNARLVTLADRTLGRNGRMVKAISAIGRGVDCFEGIPFHIDIG